MSYKPKIATQKMNDDFPAYVAKREYVRKRLKEIGFDPFELSRSEAQYLPHVLHHDETIGGAISGRSKQGHIMIVATDKRIIVIDCKPMYSDTEDITYEVVSGVGVSNVGPFLTVTLHTRLGDFVVKTIYARAADGFKRFIDKTCVEYIVKTGKFD